MVTKNKIQKEDPKCPPKEEMTRLFDVFKGDREDLSGKHCPFTKYGRIKIKISGLNSSSNVNFFI